MFYFRKDDTTRSLLHECDKYSVTNGGGTPDIEFICGDGRVPAHQVIIFFLANKVPNFHILSSCWLVIVSFSGLSSIDSKMLSSALEIGQQGKCFFLTGNASYE